MAKSAMRRRPSGRGLPAISKQPNKKLSYSMLETEPTEDFNISQSLSVVYRLRHRASSTQLKLTPELASNVIKQYLLPLFEPSQKDKRAALMRSNSDLLEAVPGTVYAELRLSSILSDKIEELKRDLSYNAQLLRDSLQEKESAVRQMEQSRDQMLQLETDCKLIRFALSQVTRTAQSSEEKVGLMAAQILAYKKMFETADAERKQLTSLLHESKATIDKLKNESLQLEHGNMLLKLENSVIGERLKGLYATLESISNKKVHSDLLECEMEQMATAMEGLTKFDEELRGELREVMAKKEDLMEMNVGLVNLRNEDHAEKTKFSMLMRDKVLQLQSDLSTLAEEKEAAVSSLEKLERKMKEIIDENQRLRMKMKNYRLKRKVNEASEQICKVCQKMYNEAENFNWSCRTHFGDFGGEMWWCCGKAGRDAPGCKITKHISKEDEDLEDHDSPTSKQNLTAVCSSCKEIGHRNADCPKDPNIRSKQDLEHELKRIHDIRERKKMAVMGAEPHEMMKSLFEERFGKTSFGVTNESSEESDAGENDEREAWEEFLTQCRQGNSRQYAKKTSLAAESKTVAIPTLMEL